MSLAQQFFDRFAGLTRAHGRYTIPVGTKANAKGKIESPDKMRVTVHAPVTVELWEQHLGGIYGLGIVPIDDNAQVHFAAIDIDVYPLDIVALDTQVRESGLPLIVCRTKSGGAHLYCFFDPPTAASTARGKLVEWAAHLGYSGVEVFPKQTRLANENDFGNWINMPYHNGERSTRYALRDGKSLTPEQFLEYANEMAVGDLTTVHLPSREPEFDQLWDGAPPCLITLADTGYPEGTRNNSLFNIIVYLKKRFPDDWALRVDIFNDRFMKPPLPQREVQDMIRSASRKNYGYKCKDQPICQACDKEVCKTRDFGVGKVSNRDPGLVFGKLTKLETDPPAWIWIVNDARVDLTTEQLLDQRAFQVRVVEVLNKIPDSVKPGRWMEIVQEQLGAVVIINVPRDATKEGQLLVHLQRFCTSRVVGKSLDELLLGKPYTDVAIGRTYFTATDFIQYLQQHRVTGVDEKKLFTWLREHDAAHHKKTIKGKEIIYWSVPRFTEQTEDHDVPRRAAEETM